MLTPRKGFAAHPGRLVLAATCLALLSGCSSSSDDTNAPLPRSGRAQATARATSVANAVAAASGHRPGRPTSDTDFSDCVGQHDEVAHDGRFTYRYTVDIDAPPPQHIAMGRQILAYMKHAKYTDVTWVPPRGKAMAVRGYTGSWYVEAGSIAGDHGPGPKIYISVTTPCLLPPGVKQQRF